MLTVNSEFLTDYFPKISIIENTMNCSFMILIYALR
jgi:hypothetical protein